MVTQMTNLKVIFWGVMGSCPGASPAAGDGIGKNTPSVQIDVGEEIVILDAGTGIVPLGNRLLEMNSQADIHLFVSHYHWDHVQGFPFFGPAYDPQQNLYIYGHSLDNFNVREVFEGLMKKPYFPAPFSVLQSKITFKDLAPGDVVELPSGLRILNIASDHPGGNLIYRIEKNAQSVCYITDLSHNYAMNDALIEFVKGTDLLIYDANFTNFEYIKPQYEGWGHSTWEKAVQLAVNANVEKLVLFHHALHRTKEALLTIEKEAKEVFPNTWLATEGQIFTLEEK